MDSLKVRQLYEERGQRAGRIDAVLDASADPRARRANIYRDYLSRRAVLRAVQPGHDERILDYGCGTGRLTMAMARRSKEVCGVDIAESMIRQAKDWAKEEAVVNVAFGRPEDLSGEFQKAFTFGVLSAHSDEEVRIAFARFGRLLEPAGRLYLFEQVRKTAQSFGDVHIQRSLDAYPRFGEQAGFELVRQRSVFRMPSYALGLWSSRVWPLRLLWLFELVERLTVDHKPEAVDYETRLFEMKPSPKEPERSA